MDNRFLYFTNHQKALSNIHFAKFTQALISFSTANISCNIWSRWC